MFTIRTATRVLFAAAVLAVLGTAQAAEKPKSVVQGPNTPPSFTYQKIESIKSPKSRPATTTTGKPPTGSGSFQSITRPFADGLAPTFSDRRGTRPGM